MRHLLLQDSNQIDEADGSHDVALFSEVHDQLSKGFFWGVFLSIQTTIIGWCSVFEMIVFMMRLSKRLLFVSARYCFKG